MLKDGKVATRLPAQDLARARAFYAEKLDLHPVEERDGGLRYVCAAGEFALFESAGGPSGDHTQMGWEVEDIEATVAALSKRGVVFEEYDVPGLTTVAGIATIEGNYASKGSGERGAWFRDSEGNLLGIGQPTSASTASSSDSGRSFPGAERVGRPAGGDSRSVAVRRAGVADAPEVARLLHDFNTEFSEPSPGVALLTERTRRLMADGEITVLLGGEHPDGIALLRFRPALWTPTLDAYLEELYVAPEQRGHGLGRALLQAAMEAAREGGAARIDLGTSEADTAARALYESSGFTNRERGPDGPIMLYYERDL